MKRWVDSRLNLMAKRDTFIHDPQEQRPDSVRSRLLEQRAPAEEQLRLHAVDPTTVCP